MAGLVKFFIHLICEMVEKFFDQLFYNSSFYTTALKSAFDEM